MGLIAFADYGILERVYFCMKRADMSRRDREKIDDEIRKKAALAIGRHRGFAKTASLLEAGISYKMILAMVESGELIRVKSGYYSLPGAELSDEEKIAAQYPEAVLTMETALFYHGYLSTRPEVWSIAVSKNTSKSRFKLKNPPVHPYFTEEAVLEMGVEEMAFGGSSIHIYTIDRLICDVFKYRDKMQTADFRSAISAYIADEKKNLDLLMKYAAQRRVMHNIKTILGTWLTLPEAKAVKQQKAKAATQPEVKSTIQPEAKAATQPEAKAATQPEVKSVVQNEAAPQKPWLWVDEPVVPEKTPEPPPKKEPVIRIKDTEPVEYFSPVEVAESVFAILQRMELLDDMSVFVRLYRILASSSVDGIAVSKRLIEFCDEEDFPLDKNRIRKMHEWGSNRFMEQKWNRFCKRQDDMSLSWQEVIKKLSSFVVPIGLAMVEHRPFTGDWMPDIGRFLE